MSIFEGPMPYYMTEYTSQWDNELVKGCIFSRCLRVSQYSEDSWVTLHSSVHSVSVYLHPATHSHISNILSPSFRIHHFQKPHFFMDSLRLLAGRKLFHTPGEQWREHGYAWTDAHMPMKQKREHGCVCADARRAVKRTWMCLHNVHKQTHQGKPHVALVSAKTLTSICLFISPIVSLFVSARCWIHIGEKALLKQSYLKGTKQTRKHTRHHQEFKKTVQYMGKKPMKIRQSLHHSTVVSYMCEVLGTILGNEKEKGHFNHSIVKEAP